MGFVRRKRFVDWTVLAVAERVLAMQDRMDLERAFVDDRGARITQEALDRVLGRIPVSAVNLDGVVGGIEGRVRGVLLGHRNVACVPKALVLHPRDFEIEEAADLVVTRHPGDHLLYQLVAPDLLTERLALASVFDRSVEAGSDGAGGARGHGEAAVGEAAHGDLETITFVADPISLGHLHVGHEDRAHVTGANAEAIRDRLGAQRLPAGGSVEHEGGDAPAPGFWSGLGDYEQ